MMTQKLINVQRGLTKILVNIDSKTLLQDTLSLKILIIGEGIDSIASHGIMMAMVSGRDAARAIVQYVSGRTDVLIAYNALLWSAFQR
jgi:hypothetical protein